MEAGPSTSNGVSGGSRPPNPNSGNLDPRPSRTGSISHQPSPAVIASASHITTHVLPRRFIGAIPESAANSSDAQAKHQRLRAVRSATIKRISGGTRAIGDKKRSVVRSIRVRRKGRDGETYEEDFHLGDSGDEEDEGEMGWFGKKGKQKRKDVWVGESFDIGREFRTKPPPLQDRDAVSEVDGQAGPSNVIAQQPTRPGVSSRQTTQESFVTARTQLSSSRSVAESEISGTDAGTDVFDVGDTPRPARSIASAPTVVNVRHSQSSSVEPLMGGAGPSQPPLSPKSKGKQKSLYPDLSNGTTSPTLRNRLKSAIRRPSAADQTFSELGRTGTVRGKSKTVQFPVELEHHIMEAAPTTQGNKAPAKPGDVLSREGEDAAGTSAGAVEEAMEEADMDEEEAILPGQVVMKDRMLVRVGYHREIMTHYDETIQVRSGSSIANGKRRKPCSRQEPLEEYLVVWRKNQVEFYQDWSTPFKERIKGYKRLCYIVPLSPTRTHMSIFNEADMSICLTTSADKLAHDMHLVLDSKTTRSTTMKDRVKQSKQAKWLQKGRKGTHVFVLKIAERSRAMDWYWEMWRELGGELPGRMDINIPSFSTTVRLALPEDEDMVGSKATCQAFSPKETIKTSYEMMAEAVDFDALVQQRSEQSGELDLKLAWKSIDGNVDWVAWDTTVQGKSRDWALLSGLAKQQGEKQPSVLQIRQANHRPRSLRLEDGSVLEDPPGVEGYLVRHTGGATAKEQVYLSVYDGCAYISLKANAYPPLVPAKEGSTPADLFPDVHHEHNEVERRRTSSFIEHSTGLVDMRDMEEVRMHTPETGVKTAIQLKRPEQCFDVRLTGGTISTFEARSVADAEEWVEKLKELASYWKRRHRVDARGRMDATAQSHGSLFAGTELDKGSDALLSNVWDWCVIKGCRPITMTGRLFVRKGKWTKYRSRLMVLTGGCLIAFKVKAEDPVHERKQRYPLFGAYTFSGMLAQEEVHEGGHQSGLASQARVYQDGLQSTDGLEDRTFCVRLSAKPSTWGHSRTQPWERMADKKWATVPLSQASPFTLIFRTRSKLERDRWIWAINAEMERQVRDNVEVEEAHRNCGNVP